MVELAPGSCVYVYDGSLRDINQYWFIYAFATDGAVWSGNYCTTVTNNEFEDCWNGTLDHQACYQLIDIDSNDNFTLTLTA